MDSTISYPRTTPAVSLVEMGPFNETSDEKLAHNSIDTDLVDTGAHLEAAVSIALAPEESSRIRYRQIRQSDIQHGLINFMKAKDRQTCHASYV